MARPRILYISPCWPNGPLYGTRLRVAQVAGALEEIGDLSFAVTGFAEENPPESRIPGRFDVTDFFAFEQGPHRSFLPRLRNSLDARLPNPHGQRVNPAAASELGSRLAGYDLIWLHHMRTAEVFERWSWPRSVLDIDDVPSTHLRTQRDNSTKPVERMRISGKMFVTRRRERLLSERFTALAVCSEEDRGYLDLPGPVHVIPNGFETPGVEPSRSPSEPARFGFIGLHKYPPNHEGIRWFMDTCWSRIRESIPGARLRLAGMGTDQEYRGAGRGIEGLGYVEDAAAEMATWSAMIVPIRRGAGTRVKIAEAFSRKCPVVSTSVGAFGYEAVQGRELFLADRPDDFADACIRIAREPDTAIRVAERAWTRFLENWTWDAIRPRVHAAAEDCLRTRVDGHTMTKAEYAIRGPR